MIKIRFIVLMLLATVVMVPAWSQTETNWQSLSEAERHILKRSRRSAGI